MERNITDELLRENLFQREKQLNEKEKELEFSKEKNSVLLEETILLSITINHKFALLLLY